MPTLRSLCGQAPVLVVDTASALIQVGVFAGDGSARWDSSAEEAGTGLFRCLERLAVDPRATGCVVYCDGPGSVLGIRTAAMAIRTWQVLSACPVHAYNSLALLAHADGDRDRAFIADARRDAWHHYSLASGFTRRATADLSGRLVMPDSFRHWTPLPPGIDRVPYVVADLLARVPDAELFHPTAAPDAFLHEEPTYVTWTPAVHRAPDR